MSKTLRRIQALVSRGEYRVSQHGFHELVADDILTDDVLASTGSAVVIEDYPDSRKEPSVLVLQHDAEGRPIHVMWGIPKVNGTPAVLVTAYRPAPDRWSHDFLKRKKR